MDLKTKLFYLGYEDGLKQFSIQIDSGIKEFPLTILSLILQYEDGYDIDRYFQFSIEATLRQNPLRLEVSDYDLYDAFII